MKLNKMYTVIITNIYIYTIPIVYWIILPICSLLLLQSVDRSEGRIRVWIDKEIE